MNKIEKTQKLVSNFEIEELEQRLEMAKWTTFVRSEQSSKEGYSINAGARVTF